MKRRTKKRFITRERQPLGGSTQLNQVWALDSTRDTLYDGRPFRTLNVIDEGNREGFTYRVWNIYSIGSACEGHESVD